MFSFANFNSVPSSVQNEYNVATRSGRSLLDDDQVKHAQGHLARLVIHRLFRNHANFAKVDGKMRLRPNVAAWLSRQLNGIRSQFRPATAISSLLKGSGLRLRNVAVPSNTTTTTGQPSPDAHRIKHARGHLACVFVEQYMVAGDANKLVAQLDGVRNSFPQPATMSELLDSSELNTSTHGMDEASAAASVAKDGTTNGVKWKWKNIDKIRDGRLTLLLDWQYIADALLLKTLRELEESNPGVNIFDPNVIESEKKFEAEIAKLKCGKGFLEAKTFQKNIDQRNRDLVRLEFLLRRIVEIEEKRGGADPFADLTYVSPETARKDYETIKRRNVAARGDYLGRAACAANADEKAKKFLTGLDEDEENASDRLTLIESINGISDYVNLKAYGWFEAFRRHTATTVDSSSGSK
jgi:hypothetical protein